MAKIYSCLSEYIREITLTSSAALGWKSIRVSKGDELSNDVKIGRVSRNTINVTLSGTARHKTRMDGIRNDRPTEPGDAILIPAGLAAEFAWQTHGGCEHTIVVEFDDDIFENYCPEILSGHFIAGHLVPTNYSPRPEVVALAHMLLRELDPSTRRGRLYAESTIRLLALEVAGSEWTHKAIAFAETVAVDPRVRRAKELIAARFTEDISLFDLTQAAGLGTGQLIALFKRQTGRTPYAYLLDRRIEHALLLLRTTGDAIACIAHGSGFSDQQHMTRAFQKRRLPTPRAIQMEARSGWHPRQLGCLTDDDAVY